MPNMALLIITGHLGKDAEESSLQSNGSPVVRFSLAVGTGWGDRKSTSWYRCTYFGDRASKVRQFLTKGKAITVIGEPTIRDWTDQAGKTRTSVEVLVKDVTLLGGGNGNGQPAETPAADPEGNEEVPF